MKQFFQILFSVRDGGNGFITIRPRLRVQVFGKSHHAVGRKSTEGIQSRKISSIIRSRHRVFEVLLGWYIMHVSKHDESLWGRE